MLKTLYAKLAVVLVVLLTLIGTVYIALTMYSTRLYLQELTQQFNRTLAADLVAETTLIQNGQVDHEALTHIFHVYMDINPKIEVYLLDWRGKILTYSAPPGKVKRGHVSLEPLDRLLHDIGPLPIVGDDPRNLNGKKVFSASRIGPEEKPEGYLYVVLRGERFDSMASILESSYFLRLTTWTALGIMIVGVIAGLVLFNFLTRRLTNLTLTMKAFQQSKLEHIPVSPELDTRSKDEIGQLGATFKHMAHRIVQQMNALKEADTLRRELVANVSHDLRTPLASLQGYLETLLLKETTLSNMERHTYLEIALKDSKKLTHLVEELFELAKLDSHDTQLRFEAFSLVDLIQDILLKLQLNAKQVGITLSSQIPEHIPLILGDIALIERVLENLIENALRYTTSPGTITITLHLENQSVIVKVEDTGCGIPDKDLPHIFDRFYQVPDPSHQRRGGAGLGLAIAKRILDLHKSPISVHSLHDQGTTFSFPLPIPHT
jgi:signal transduction histidine kinase